MKGFRLLILIGIVTFGNFALTAQTTKAKTKNTKAVTVAPATQHSSKAVAAQIKGVHMTFENEHLNIGKVKKGEIKKFDFIFTNTGTETIEIDIASGCDCTTLDYPKNKILPGKKGVIHVTFDSGKKEESETVDVDLYLKNLNPKTGQRILKIIDYKYELLK
ncbi:MAG: DUF1573 domain-containing protein [Saprospiraceae bacterium]|nr:DUF1573 domain-containing protein [Saprospiraceae bacterium]